MRRVRKLGKLAQGVFKDLIVVPAKQPPVSPIALPLTYSPRPKQNRPKRKGKEGAQLHLVSFNERGGIFSSRFQ